MLTGRSFGLLANKKCLLNPAYKGGVFLKTISTKIIVEEVARLCIEANYYISNDVMQAFQKSWAQEESKIGKDVIEQLIENAKIASDEAVPMCQDTGYAVFFVELGQDVHIVDNLPVVVVNDVHGGDLYQEGKEKYKRI